MKTCKVNSLSFCMLGSTFCLFDSFLLWIKSMWNYFWISLSSVNSMTCDMLLYLSLHIRIIGSLQSFSGALRSMYHASQGPEQLKEHKRSFMNYPGTYARLSFFMPSHNFHFIKIITASLAYKTKMEVILFNCSWTKDSPLLYLTAAAYEFFKNQVYFLKLLLKELK